jgi:flagellar L-ring protein FlgH
MKISHFVMLKHDLRVLVAAMIVLGLAAAAGAQAPARPTPGPSPSLLGDPPLRPNLGPSSSLLGDPSARRPLTMADVSWTYQATPDSKKWKVNDMVTVLIQEKTTMKRDGMVDERRKDTRSATLTDWILFRGFSFVPDPQSGGDPTLGSLIDNKYQAQANLQNKDLFETDMQCVVVDIRPNGTLVIEGHGRVQLDEEVWELSLSGVVQADDILPNKTVKSEKIAEKQILKRSAGHGRDGLRRGWFLKWWDKYSPF